MLIYLFMDLKLQEQNDWCNYWRYCRQSIDEFGYDLSRTLDEIRPAYRHIESCQGTVPEAITAFLEGTDFEDVVRCAVSLGGDCDTLTCIATGIAEAFYSVPDFYKEEALSRIEPDMRQVYEQFATKIQKQF